MHSETIRYTVEDGVARIMLNRPERLNSFTAEMHEALAKALDTADEAPSVRAILLTGAGRGFCAGQDLADRAVAPGGKAVDLGETVEKYWAPLVKRLASRDKPVVCAVNGVAAGAGANVAFACDIVIAARSAKFIQSFANIGLIPDTGGTWVLPRIAGQARALGLALTAEPLSAEKAEQWGMIYKAVDDAALMMSVLSRPDWRDATSLPLQDIDWLALDGDVKGLRLGLLLDAGWGLPTDPEVRACIAEAARRFEAAGAIVEPLAPFTKPEVPAGIDQFWRMRSWLDMSALPEERRARVLPFIRDWVAPAAGMDAPTLFRGFSRIAELRDRQPAILVQVWGNIHTGAANTPVIVATDLLAGDLAPTPTATVLPPTVQPTIRVNFNLVNLYAGPGPAYGAAGQVILGQVCNITGRNNTSTWLAQVNI